MAIINDRKKGAHLQSARRGKRKVVHLSSSHHPDDARIYWKECLSLAHAGYDVTFVVPGSEPPLNRDKNSGVDVLLVRRQLGRRRRLLILPFTVFIVGLRQGGDIYHFHDPELLPAGCLLRLLGKLVIYDAHEDLPRDILMKSWVPHLMRRPLAAAAGLSEWLASKVLSGFVAATPAIAARFPPERTALVQNYAKPAEFQPVSQRSDPPVIAYVGGITPERCGREMVNAMEHLECFPNARLILAGRSMPAGFVGELQRLPGWKRVEYRGSVNRDGVRALLQQACIGLALFYPVQAYIESQPVKLFEYMAAGIPVIASDFPCFRQILEGHGCGLCIPHDAAALASAIESLLADPAGAAAMGGRGRRLMQETYSWDSEERTLLKFYQRITQPVRVGKVQPNETSL